MKTLREIFITIGGVAFLALGMYFVPEIMLIRNKWIKGAIFATMAIILSLLLWNIYKLVKGGANIAAAVVTGARAVGQQLWNGATSVINPIRGFKVLAAVFTYGFSLIGGDANAISAAKMQLFTLWNAPFLPQSGSGTSSDDAMGNFSQQLNS